MQQEHKSIKDMWVKYLDSVGEDLNNTNKKYAAWYFCDNEKDANELSNLVLDGIKKATASLYLSYEFEKEDIPKVGDYSIITNWDGIAQCIIRTKKVDIVPYIEVTENFAAKEGEGDKSLEYWRKCHWDYFTKEMKEMGNEPNNDMLVICEEFEVVYKK